MDFSCGEIPLNMTSTHNNLRADIAWSIADDQIDAQDPIDFCEVALQTQSLARQFDAEHIDILANQLASALCTILGQPQRLTVSVRSDGQDGLFGSMSATAEVRASDAPTDMRNSDNSPTANTTAARMIDGVSFPVPVNGTFATTDATAERDHHTQASSDTVGVDTAINHAVIAMESSAVNARDLLRASIVMFDGIPGNQISGISPLYFTSSPNGDVSSTAVLGLDTTMNLADLIRMIDSVGMTHEGIVKLSVLAFNGESVPDAMQPGSWAVGNRTRAAFLAPWSDMEPQATLDGDPLAFLLASAPDAMFSGLDSDHWILGGEH